MVNTIRIPALIQSTGRRPAYNIWHMQNTSENLADAQAATDLVRDFYTGAAGHFQNTATITIGTQVASVDLPTNVIYPVTPRTVVGGTAGTAAPYQLANVVSLRTPFVGRSFRGRIYLGPLAASAINDPTMNGALVTAAQTAINTLVASGKLVVYSEKIPAATVVTSALVNANIETQRRRARN
jgi:hypothetical protein